MAMAAIHYRENPTVTVKRCTKTIQADSNDAFKDIEDEEEEEYPDTGYILNATVYNNDKL